MGAKQFFRDVNRTSKDIANVIKDEPVGMFKWFTYAFWFISLTIAFGVAYMLPGWRKSLKEAEPAKTQNRT